MSEVVSFQVTDENVAPCNSRTTDEYLNFINKKKTEQSILDACVSRHSVRTYIDKPISDELKASLKTAIDEINRESGLNFQLVTDDRETFSDGKSVSYGSFTNCTNYFVLAGKKGCDEKVGYYGEKLVLISQILGLNTCWVALTYRKGKARYELKEGEKLYLVIALGYGENQGRAHTSKTIEQLSTCQGEMPLWFKQAMECAMLAPTAINQQKFRFTLLDNGKVLAKRQIGPYSKIDLGIAKYHFEIGARGHRFEYET